MYGKGRQGRQLTSLASVLKWCRSWIGKKNEENPCKIGGKWSETTIYFWVNFQFFLQCFLRFLVNHCNFATVWRNKCQMYCPSWNGFGLEMVYDVPKIVAAIHLCCQSTWRETRPDTRPNSPMRLDRSINARACFYTHPGGPWHALLLPSTPFLSSLWPAGA